MLDRTAFLASFPEFSETDVAVIDAKLAEASRRIAPATWGVWENDGHGQLTAHLLANSPLGNSAKLEAGVTVYSVEFNRLVRMVGAGLRST